MLNSNNTIMRLVHDVNTIKSALRRVVSNLPLYDIANEDTPATLSADQNNYVPGNYDVLRLNATTNITITGFAGGQKGRFLEIINIGTGRISFPDEDTSSLPQNRIATPYDQTVTILTNARIRFYYDSTQERWTVSDLPNIQGEFGKYSVISHSTFIVHDDVPAITPIQVEPDTVVSDEWDYWNSTNHNFVIPQGESGIYSLFVNFSWSSPDTTDYTGNLLIYKNYPTTLVAQQYLKFFGADNNVWTMSLTAYALLESGDTLTVRVQQINGSSLTRDLRLISSGSPIFIFSKVG